MNFLATTDLTVACYMAQNDSGKFCLLYWGLQTLRGEDKVQNSGVGNLLLVVHIRNQNPCFSRTVNECKYRNGRSLPEKRNIEITSRHSVSTLNHIRQFYHALSVH
jgi:hypothetical protein